MGSITASWDTLLDQASSTTDTYFRRMVRIIDDEFGDGYAKKNPELVGRLVQTCAIDFASAGFGKVIGELADVIETKDFSGG